MKQPLHQQYLTTYTCYMGQVTVYLPGDVLELARKCASERHMSLSAWVNSLIRDATVTDWPADFLDVLAHGGANIEEPDDPLPEQVETLS